MNRRTLHRFVVQGFTKNKKTVIPFLLAGSFMVAMFFILYSLTYSPYLYRKGVGEAFYGAQTLTILLNIGYQIIMIFSAIFILYANRFVMKGRKKEMALYGILGLTKKNINRILIVDMAIKALVTIGAGLLLGSFLCKLMLLVLYKIIHQPPVIGSAIGPKGYVVSTVLFLLIYLICLISNIFSVNIASPVELLRSDKVGEKEPKVKLVMLLLGLASMGFGYYVAMSTSSTGEAIGNIFVAVFFVIIGTYFLFISGSIFVLKVLKKSKRFYYKTRNFISVSNLLYRMKHNATGLASICILSTGVLILLISAASLFMLGEDNINRMYPTDITIFKSMETSMNREDFLGRMEEIAEETGVTIENGKYINFYNSFWMGKNGEYNKVDEDTNNFINSLDVYMMTADEYNLVTDSHIVLEEGQVLARFSVAAPKDKVTLLGKEYTIVGVADYDKCRYIYNSSMGLFQNGLFVVDSQETMDEFKSMDKMMSGVCFVGYDTTGDWTEEERNSFSSKFGEYMQQLSDVKGEISYKQEEIDFFYNIYGGTFFLGMFLAAIFLVATALIIYYKQISEGVEDRERYRILDCVGLTDTEIKATIRRQVLLIFFLPLCMAFIHMAVASKIVRLFLNIILLVDGGVFIGAMLVMYVSFALFYGVIYKVTSKQYYRIVNGEK